MPFNIIRDDITRLETDAVVNAANSRLMQGGGVCGAIFAAAGASELQAACNKIGYCKTGDAVITKGFNLKAKYIIHTVGPIYGENPKEEERQLYSCYKNSLELAKKYGVESIAFPLISSGIYGYPKAEALKIATKAVKDFLAGNDMDVYLVVYDNSSFQISSKLFDSVKSYIDDRMIMPDTRPKPCCSADYMAAYTEDRKAAIDHEATLIPAGVSQRKPFKKEESLDALLKKKTETFSEMLLRFIDERGMSDVEVYKRANIDRKLFSKMRKKDYAPKKTTVMALIIALRLDMYNAKSLLNRAGFAFSESSRFDIIIEYFIENGIYDIYEINETLFAFQEKLLGA